MRIGAAPSSLHYTSGELEMTCKSVKRLTKKVAAFKRSNEP